MTIDPIDPLRNLFLFQKSNWFTVFRGGKHNGNWLIKVSKDYVMGLEHIMNAKGRSHLTRGAQSVVQGVLLFS